MTLLTSSITNLLNMSRMSTLELFGKPKQKPLYPKVTIE